MWLIKTVLSSLCVSALVCAAPFPALPWERSTAYDGGEFKSLGCPRTTKPWATPREQLYAVTNYYDMLFGGNPAKAFAQWTAKDFINHAPDVTGDGRAAAEKAVDALLSTSKEEIKNVFVGKNSSGVDFAHIYFKGINSHGVGAIMEFWRFSGNCLVEHWNIAEQVSGVNTSNPKAFF
ncbi:MAG: hypothetical protein GOMPHAMPRED_008120 [Gomphillus americanus]|uniref:SnoaL-like domain-containing protein n=1 Tax=Gomphillus americanus TaxID=1940652 RepID=A0A8H3EX42_9LECA|nr:MAG: hypothetical protein GOMPHAMPRED_008120 [Gomphillus americanus]